MDSEKFEAMQSSASRSIRDRFGTLLEKAEQAVMQKSREMIERGEAFDLSDDECRMIRAYRGFVRRSPPGLVFSWQTPATGPTAITLLRPTRRQVRSSVADGVELVPGGRVSVHPSSGRPAGGLDDVE